MSTLGPAGVKAFERRGINPETAARYGIYTVDGNVVVFPFVERGAVVNEKFRAPDKKFWQQAGGRRTFWNSDALDDPSLETGQNALVITEGEIDCLTAIDCGFPLSVSVPDGAPPVAAGEDPAQLSEEDPASEASGKFEFVYNNRDRLKRIKRFILAVDNDPPGQRLAAELVRRLSASRCYFVEYPAGCKDLNDVLMKHGSEVAAGVLNAAKPYPVRGLYRLSDYPDAPGLRVYSTGWWTVDQCMQVYPGEFIVVGGIPGHGKSSWLTHLLYNLAHLHGWRSVIFSPEMPTVPNLRDRLRAIGSGIGTDKFIEGHFYFIGSDPTHGDDEDFDLEWIIQRATDAVDRYGIRILLIDPWNEVEHARGRNESMTDYIGRSIRALKRFARERGVLVIVAAHPTKEVWRDGKARPLSLYDIAESAHWYNKCDHGLVVERPNEYESVAILHVLKVRFEASGRRGQTKLRYDGQTCRFLTLEGECTERSF